MLLEVDQYDWIKYKCLRIKWWSQLYTTQSKRFIFAEFSFAWSSTHEANKCVRVASSSGSFVRMLRLSFGFATPSNVPVTVARRNDWKRATLQAGHIKNDSFCSSKLTGFEKYWQWSVYELRNWWWSAICVQHENMIDFGVCQQHDITANLYESAWAYVRVNSHSIIFYVSFRRSFGDANTSGMIDIRIFSILSTQPTLSACLMP